MRQRKGKKRLLCLGILSAAVAVPAVLEHTGALPRAAARVSTGVYAAVRYPRQGLHFRYTEFVPQFGNYAVYYRDRQGRQIAFSVMPKVFPVIVIVDPLDPPV